jgi:hypothetical protein
MSHDKKDTDPLRIRIAEALGWTQVYYRKPHIDNSLVGIKPGEPFWRDLPEWPTDLNAMHDLECALADDSEAWEQYCATLWAICNASDDTAGAINASALQKAEAFIRVKEGA